MTDEQDGTLSAYEGWDVYVAMLLPDDGSGKPVVLGVYSSQEFAEARCWRCLQNLGYDQPTAVIVRPLDLDNEGDDPKLDSVEQDTR